MAVVIDVLALNDDNHETSFHSSWNNEKYCNHMEFIQKLAKPHFSEYKIRCVYLLDIDEDNELALEAFDVVQSGRDGKNMRYTDAFRHLWKISKENMFA